jgi:hypothetical protein
MDKVQRLDRSNTSSGVVTPLKRVCGKLDALKSIRLIQDVGPVVGSCKHGNGPSGSVNSGKFLYCAEGLSAVQ